MNKLTKLKKIADLRRQQFHNQINTIRIGSNEFDWYIAMEAVKNNIATIDQKELAGYQPILEAHKKYIKSLHKFYTCRDGSKGFLDGK